MSNTPPKPKPLIMQLPDDLGIEYVNVVRIAHSPSELVFDFGNLLPGGIPPKVSSRIIMTPVAAKLFLKALAENLQKYEAQYGVIQTPGNKSLADYLFKHTDPPEKPPERE